MTTYSEENIPDTLWVEYHNKEKNKPYFYNKETKTTTWTVPPDYAQWKDLQMKKYLDSSTWRQHEKDGRVYYSNKLTKASQWQVPDDVKAFETFLVALTIKRKVTTKRKVEEEVNDSHVGVKQGDPSISSQHPAALDGGIKIARTSEEDLSITGEVRSATKGAFVARADDYSDSDREEDYVQEEDYGFASFKGLGSTPISYVATPTEYVEQERTPRSDGEYNYSTKTKEDSTPNEYMEHDGTATMSDYHDDYQRGGYAQSYEERTSRADESDSAMICDTEVTVEETIEEMVEETVEETVEEMVEETVDETAADVEDESAADVEDETAADVEDETAADVEDETAADVEDESAAAHEKLSAKEAIMEVGIEGSIKQCLADSSPQDVIKQLIDGYSGYAQMSHIVSEWLAIATHIERGPAVAPAAPSSSHLSTGQRPSTNTSTDDPEATVVTHLAAMIKQRFDAATADAIIPRLKGTPEWLKRMMADETFRKMLIELYDQNRSSTLIRVSLKEISKMGHHREIAHVIPDLDYFEVFGDSEPLVDILVRVCFEEGEGLDELLGILKRMCCNTEYMFLYTMSLLAKVDLRMGEEIVDEEFRRTAVGGGEEDENPADQIQSSLITRRRKLRRIRQELEDTAVWQKRESSSGALTSEASFALKLVGTYTKSAQDADAGRSGGGGLKTELLDAVRGDKVTATHLHRILSCYFGEAAQSDPDGLVITDTLLAHLGAPVHYLRAPVVLELLVRALVHPTKMLPDGVSRRAAKLLALACGSAYDEVEEDSGPPADHPGESARAVVALEEALVETRLICLELSERAVGVTCYDRPKQLLALLGAHAGVSMCALRWVGFMLADSTFTSKAAFLSVLPVFLQLAVEAGQRHPLQLPDCFDIFRSVLVLSPAGDEDEVKGFKASADAYTIVTGQKEALDCLVHQMGAGFLTQPMAFLTAHQSELDAVLVRHLLRTLLLQVKPPFSRIFATKLVELMSTETSRKAFLSAHFLRKDAVALSSLSKELVTFLSGDGKPSALVNRFLAVVQECVAMHRLSIH